MSAVSIPEAPQAIALSVAQLSLYAGSYTFSTEIVSRIRVADGKLFEQSSGQPETELVPVGVDLFYAPPDLHSRTSFERDADGKVVAQIYRSGTQMLRAPKRD